jgi:naphthalene 1,2-dioxygenase system ferredoxin subunit
LAGAIDMTDPKWIRVVSTTEVKEAGGLLGRSVSGVALAVYEADGAYFVTSDICTHGQANLSDGYLEDFLIECPYHQGKFDIRTGEVAGSPCTEPVCTFPVRHDGEDLFVSLDAIEKFKNEPPAS